VTTKLPEGQDTVDLGRACLLITGAPGAGKSTVSGLVARALSRSALLDAYFVSGLVVSGYVWPLGKPADEAARQVRLLITNLCSLATNFAAAGFTPVIDVVVADGEQLTAFREALASYRLLLVVLDPGTAVCKHRNEVRPPQDQFFFDGYEELRVSMHDGFGDRGWWFDTSELTPGETAKQILAESVTRASFKV
jgi:hypothetical protein